MRAAITGDFFRLSLRNGKIHSEQIANLRWLEELLKPATDGLLTTEIVYPEGTADDMAAFVDNQVYASAIEQDPIAAWLAMYDAPLSESLFDPLLDRLAAFDIVIGFELSPNVKKRLNSRSIPYICLYNHPVRFLPDLLFGVTTNIPQVDRALADIDIDGLVQAHVARLKALFKRIDLPHAHVPDGAAMMIGQTRADSVLLSNGRFACWDDYRDRLKTELEPASCIYILEHPYELQNQRAAEFFRHELRKPVILCRGNSYAHIFGRQRYQGIYTLSSSMGVEASLAGHSVSFLLSDPRASFFVTGADTGSYRHIGHALLSRDFWRAVASGQQPKTASAGLFALGDDYVRSTLDAWGFRLVRSGAHVEQSTKSILPGEPWMKEAGGRLVRQSGWRKAIADADAPYSLDDDLLTIHVHAPPAKVTGTWRLPIGSHAGNYFLLSGFHAMEATHAWSSQASSQIILPLDNVRQSLSVMLKVAIFDPLLPRCPVLTVSHAGNVMAVAMFNPEVGGETKIDMNFECVSHPVVIDFGFSDHVSPKEIGMNEDVRSLGFRITAMEVTVGATNSDLDGLTVPPLPRHVYLGGQELPLETGKRPLSIQAGDMRQ